jgi:hypothetical protein
MLDYKNKHYRRPYITGTIDSTVIVGDESGSF